ncbi:MAG: hypothetical protein J6V17_03015 [Bacteroidales bacterium]|nr:hypothetical protein [Bacteroidales bacterium]
MKSSNVKILNGGGSYEAPLAKVVEIQPEGVLCGSAAQYGSDLDDLTENDYNW